MTLSRTRHFLSTLKESEIEENHEPVSNCCGARPLGDLHNTDDPALEVGICAACRDHADFDTPLKLAHDWSIESSEADLEAWYQSKGKAIEAQIKQANETMERLSRLTRCRPIGMAILDSLEQLRQFKIRMQHEASAEGAIDQVLGCQAAILALEDAANIVRKELEIEA